jgi:hypothetical protein
MVNDITMIGASSYMFIVSGMKDDLSGNFWAKVFKDISIDACNREQRYSCKCRLPPILLIGGMAQCEVSAIWYK